MSRLQDQRKRPLTIDWELDDLPLSSRAFRVYSHLIRRAGLNGAIFPSYASIGEHCFKGDMPDAKPDSRRSAAIRAVKELEEYNLIKVVKRKSEDTAGNQTNIYVLTDKSEWTKVVMPDDYPSDVTSLPLVTTHHYPSDVTSPKGTTKEVTTNKKKGKNAFSENLEPFKRLENINNVHAMKCITELEKKNGNASQMLSNWTDEQLNLLLVEALKRTTPSRAAYKWADFISLKDACGIMPNAKTHDVVKIQETQFKVGQKIKTPKGLEEVIDVTKAFVITAEASYFHRDVVLA